jgi:hypothetical protein
MAAKWRQAAGGISHSNCDSWNDYRRKRLLRRNDGLSLTAMMTA